MWRALTVRASVITAIAVCEVNPWQAQATETISNLEFVEDPFYLNATTCDSASVVRAEFESLRTALGTYRPSLLQRVSELPLPARQALSQRVDGSLSGPYEVADFDQVFAGGCVSYGVPHRKLVMAACTPAGGWLYVVSGGFRGEATVFVYGAREMTLHWLVALPIEPVSSPLWDFAWQLLRNSYTPEPATPGTQDYLAKAIIAHIRDATVPSVFYMPKNAPASGGR